MAVSNEAWRGTGGAPTSSKPEEAAALMQRLMYEVKRVVVGQDAFLERVLIALLAQGHLLIEGVPGLAKTLTVNTLAKPSTAVSAAFNSHPICCPPIWWAHASSTNKPANSALCWGQCLPTCCWPMKLTVHLPRYKVHCWK